MKRDKWTVIAMAATWLVAGAVEPHLPNAGQSPNAVTMVQTLVLSFLFFGWCKAHSAQHQINPPTAAPLLVAILAPVGVPYYFFRGFGWRKGFLWSLAAAGCFIVFIVLYVVSFMVSARVGT